MIVLATTNSKLQLITSAVGTVVIDGAYVDRDLTTPAAPTDDTGEIDVSISTATTTDLLAAPAANHRRNVRHLTIRNSHATVANTCTLQKNISATLYEKMKFTLQPGEYAVIPESGAPFVYDVGGGVKTAIAAPSTRTVLTAGSGATYTTPVGCRAIDVEVIGGGGAGGGATSVASAGGGGGGGGSGGITRKLFSPPAATYTYTIGAGGTAGAAGAAGNAGADTTFGTLTAKGGSGGAAATSAAATRALGGAGGVAGSGGDINGAGEPGRTGINTTAALVASGAGGPSEAGGGAPGVTAQGAGVAAIANSGGGGSGGASVSAGAAVAGGAGGSGAIIVTEYY
jgi:hypothetical protein